MNWLGRLIQKEISKNDTVLDLGCGILQEFIPTVKSNRRNLIERYRMNRKSTLKCKSMLCVDIFQNYLERIKEYFPVIQQDIRNTDNFLDSSFDIVICIDVLEHLELNEAQNVLSEMKRIARKKAIIYTPKNYETNESATQNVWKLGDNPLQKHKCVIPTITLEELGFVLSFYKPYKNTFGIWIK